ncbi:MAG: hypothetical protein Q9212_007090 [Teloschistes hypoglaucus]
MPPQGLHRTTTLPRSLREESGVSETSASKQRNRTIPGIRKDRRKAARTEKKLKKPAYEPTASRDGFRTSIGKNRSKDPATIVHKTEHTTLKKARVGDALGQSQPKSPQPKRVPKEQKIDLTPSLSSSPEPRNLSKGVKDRLAADDAEIAALEAALGVKGKKKLPKSFEEDGLDVLLEGLEDDVDGRGGLKKRKRSEGEEWLEEKRKKARVTDHDAKAAAVEVYSSDDEDTGSSFGGLGDGEDASDDEIPSAGEESDGYLSSEDLDNFASTATPAKKATRENPYHAPATSATPAPKYVPPSLRTQTASESEDLSRLRRRMKGLINRLSEANILSILGDIESLYRNQPRQHVSSTLLDILVGLLSDPSALQDTFIILHAGFVTAVYKMIGSDFGAQVIQRVDEEFGANYVVNADGRLKDKKLINLMSLVSQLHTFQMIGSKLLYDYIKLFIKELSEDTAELLLKILRNSGTQLRQDDPSALKEIVLLVQNAVTTIGEKNLSVRTKFMIETINNLKNNRMKTGIAASSLVSEHVVRMKKTLGSLNTRNIKASEPLRVGLQDIRESDKRGKWWLVGASYKDPAELIEHRKTLSEDNESDGSDEGDLSQGVAGNLLQIAREQRMNTDVRRSIFVAIMSATDYNDAFQRLKKLRLKKSQELEMPKVMIHCAGAEEAYNPYYTLLARRVCTDRKLKMAFQFSLWGFLKRLGENVEEDEDEAVEEEDRPGMRTIVNLAKMFGVLIAEGGLTLNALKILNFAYLQPQSSIFAEVLLITVILHPQKGSSGSRDEAKIVEIFMQARIKPEMVKGLLYFLKKTVSKSDVAGTEADKETVKWGCRVARDALKSISISKAVAGPFLASSAYTFQQPTCQLLRRQDRGYATEAAEHDLVIIGGGVAGYVAAIKAGQEGLKVACIEKRGALGGTCLNVGCIPSKSLLNNSHLYHQILHDTKKRGIEVGDVKLNLKQMMSAKDTSVQGLTKGVEFLFKKNNVEYIPGTGALAGEHEVKVNKIDGGEATLLAKNIIIATGSEATPFPGLTIDEKKVVTSTGAIALQEVPKKMVVIGGGIIGLEMGSVWSRLGSDVTVVEFLGQIGGPGMDAEISKTTQKILGKQGMKFKLNTKVLSGDDSGEGVKLEVEASKGGKKETLDADVVLVAIGRRPYTAGLGLENIGLDVDNKGRLVIDEQYRTKHPHIRVIGDCTFGPMLAHKAEEEAVAAIEYITKGHGHVNYGAIPSVMYTHPEVAWVGQNEAELKEQNIKYRVGTFPFSANSRAKTNLETEGIVKFISDAETDRILGIHIVGPNAGEMIAEGVLAVEYGASSEDVARTSHAHPTLAEAFKEAAMATYSKAIHY